MSSLLLATYNLLIGQILNTSKTKRYCVFTAKDTKEICIEKKAVILWSSPKISKQQRLFSQNLESITSNFSKQTQFYPFSPKRIIPSVAECKNIKDHVSFSHHLASVCPSVVCRKLPHLNLVLWNCCTKIGWDGGWVDYFLNFVPKPHPPFKMATVTENRNFFNCLLLLYYKSKWAQILTAARWQ
jgi:hypothetical protein